MVQSYDELLAKKDKLKEKNSQLIIVIQKITNSSEQVDPLTSSTSEESIKQLEKVARKAKAVDSWVDQLIDQNTQVVKKALHILGNVRAAKVKLNQTLVTFNQSLV